MRTRRTLGVAGGAVVIAACAAGLAYSWQGPTTYMNAFCLTDSPTCRTWDQTRCAPDQGDGNVEYCSAPVNPAHCQTGYVGFECEQYFARLLRDDQRLLLDAADPAAAELQYGAVVPELKRLPEGARR